MGLGLGARGGAGDSRTVYGSSASVSTQRYVTSISIPNSMSPRLPRSASMRGSSVPGAEGRSDCSEPLGTSMRPASAATRVLQHSSASCCWKPPWW